MFQRNDTDHPIHAHTEPPQVIEPGQVIEWQDLVVGMTPCDPPAAPAVEPAAQADDEQDEPAEDPAPTPARKARRTTTAQEG